MCDAAFDGDRVSVLERAGAAGVGAVIAVSEGCEDIARNVALAEELPMLRPAGGLHPALAESGEGARAVAMIRERSSRLVAVGEVGLDYWVAQEEAQRELQRELFGRFIRLAAELDLPLNVHSRSAGRQTVEQLLAAGARRVQMHAFDGRAAAALPAVEAGFFFSVPPSIVRSRQKEKLVARLPLSSLLVETDSPVLAAVPTERNEPANVLVAVDAIAAIKGLSRDAVLEAVSENAARLYGRLT